MTGRAARDAAVPSGDPEPGEGQVAGPPRPRAGVVWPVVGAATALAVGAVALVWAERPLPALALAAFTVVLGWLSGIDLRERRLPNRIVGPLSAATVAGVAVAGALAADPWRAVAAMGIGVAFSAGLLALSLFGAVGMGDVKLAFPIGMVAGWFGVDAVLATVMGTALSGAMVGGAALLAGKGRHHTLPYGPFLALGSLAGILVGAAA